LLQRVVEIDATKAQGWKNAEQEACCRGDEQRERENACIDSGGYIVGNTVGTNLFKKPVAEIERMRPSSPADTARKTLSVRS
jgi:hypothetical protein